MNDINLQVHVSDRRDEKTVGRLLGHVVSCSGGKVEITADVEADDNVTSQGWSVGCLVSIEVSDNRVVALVCSMDMAGQGWKVGQANTLHVTAELVGEVRAEANGESFSSGITKYPYLGAHAHDIRASDLKLIYDVSSEKAVTVGKLSQNMEMDASICIPSMLSRHFALVGTTGVGKSTALSLLINKAIVAEPKLRVLVLDLHDEFETAFGQKAVALGPDTLDLPFWLFKFDEFAEVIFNGQPKTPSEMIVLRELIADAKKRFKGDSSASLTKRKTNNAFTADTPVPYRIADLLAQLDERIGSLDGKSDKPFLIQLKTRISAAISNPRFSFMFSSNTINDTIIETIGTIFRIPGDDKPITTLQLGAIPSEVVDSVASVLSRLAFEIALWSEGALKILLVCEEAHRYISANAEHGFLPTRQAISRIAKEGRKYGVGLGIVTQRPGELDPTILSQCSTVFAMRLANDHDQEIIRSALPNSSSSTTSFLASIGNGEAIAFGEAVPVPMRMMFERVPNYALPNAHGAKDNTSSFNIRTIVERMRSSEGLRKPPDEDMIEDKRADISLQAARRAEELRQVENPAPKLQKLAENNRVSSNRERLLKPAPSDDGTEMQKELSDLRARLLRK